MTTRRSFFRRLSAVVAGVAVAPKISLKAVADKPSGRKLRVSKSDGCTLSAARIHKWTPAEFEEMWEKEALKA